VKENHKNGEEDEKDGRGKPVDGSEMDEEGEDDSGDKGEGKREEGHDC